MTFLAGSGKLDELVAVACSLVQTVAKIYFIWLYTMHYSEFISIIHRFTEMTYKHLALKKVNKVHKNHELEQKYTMVLSVNAK